MKLTPITNPIDTKADKVHTHTTAQVTGLDAALTDANWHKGDVPAGATLDDLPRGTYHIQGGSIAENLGLPARVGSLEISPGYYGTKTATAVVNLVNGTSHEVWTNTQNGNSGEWMGWRKSVLIDPASSTTNLDLRRDTTVGTRIFAGDTMIHGDTGWRDISGDILVPVVAGARVYIRRTGIHVYLSADVLRFDETVPATTPFLAVPEGFRAIKTYRTSGAYEAGAIYSQLGGAQLALRETQTGSSRFYISYLTDNSWPTTLPGIPA